MRRRQIDRAIQTETQKESHSIEILIWICEIKQKNIQDHLDECRKVQDPQKDDLHLGTVKKLPYVGGSCQTTSGFKNLDTLELDVGIALEALDTGTSHLDELHIGETFLELPDNGEAF